MRKRYKNKKRCCILCKSYKRGYSHRWKNKEMQKLKQAEKEIQKAKVF